MSHVFIAAGVVVIQGHVLIQNLEHFVVEVPVLDAVEGIIRGIFVEGAGQVIDHFRSFSSRIFRNELNRVHMREGGHNFLILLHQCSLRLINSLLPLYKRLSFNNRV